MTHGHKKHRIAVLFGGPSAEHAVSVKSGRNVMEALDRKKYQPVEVYVTKKGIWGIPPEKLHKEADVVFVALHGAYGEDGGAQTELEAHGLPYTGSGALASALAMNKFLSGQLFRDAGLLTPLSFFVAKKNWHDAVPRVWNWVRYFAAYPVVIKPNNGGSSVAVSIARNKDEVVQGLEKVFRVSNEALVQNYVRGREVTCGVLDHGMHGKAMALPVTEILPKVGTFFDYDAKYQPGATEEITPARLTHAFTQAVQRAAVHAHKLVGARGFSRTDMIVDREGRVHVLEVNTIPGLTEQSLIPKAAAAAGIEFPVLLDHLIEVALKYKKA